MANIQPVRLSTHSSLNWRANDKFAFAKGALVVPIAAQELSQAAINFPLCIAVGNENPLVALTGLGNTQNLFVSPDDLWMGNYTPAVLRAYPFKLLPAESDQFALGYDHDSGLLCSDDGGEPFFLKTGEPSERVREILGFLIGVSNGLQKVAVAVELLVQADVLEPWPLKVRDGEREASVDGILRVSETRLADLDDAAFLTLRKNGALTLAHLQMFSMGNISVLERLSRIHHQHASKIEQGLKDVQSMFEPLKVDDEIDWDAMLKDD